MQTYTIDTLSIGLSHQFAVTITREMMSGFLAITGDNNPMHVDASYAQNNGMRQEVVYGMLTASFYSTLVGVYLPGKLALLHSVDTQFLKPVFVGDTLTVQGEVVEVNPVFKQVLLKAVIINQKGEKVSRAKIKAGLLHE